MNDVNSTTAPKEQVYLAGNAEDSCCGIVACDDVREPQDGEPAGAADTRDERLLRRGREFEGPSDEVVKARVGGARRCRCPHEQDGTSWTRTTNWTTCA
jgi:hypothetical protein